MKILLINYEMGYGIPPTRVQGYSGVTYATSHFDRSYACHVAEIEVADYNKAAKDLSRAWHLSMRRWVPIFPESLKEEEVVVPGIQEPEEPKVPESNLPFDLPSLPNDETSQIPARDEMEKMHLSSLKKLARNLGLIQESIGTREEIIEALLAHK